jgi:hypothetical protein
MYSNAKAIRLIQDINDLLSVRFPAGAAGLNTITQGFYVDANNASWPYLLISHNGVVTEGSPVVYIEISNVDAVSKDIFGNQTYAYAPHILQFAYELSGAAGTNPIPAHSDLITAEFEAIKSGVRVQLKEIPNGTQVTPANANAAAVTADLDQLYWPTKLV